ncbi:hypothetical protein ACPA5B_12925 [Pseudomonas solani]|uniref:hypothetical protein n=1 Tax=Pseudomonas solani TaxID=2731552 RepID=UPI003C2C79C6
MVPGYFEKLLSIANDPQRGWANRLAATRMAIRKAAQQHDLQQGKLWDQRRHMREHLPFTRHTLKELEAAQHAHLASYQALLRSTGQLLIANEPQVLDELDTPRLLDLLGVNPTHRRRIPRNVERLLCVVVLQGLEDSARQFSGRQLVAPRSGPLARAFNEVMVCTTLHTLRNSPGKIGRQAGTPPQRRNECAAPTLTVYNADGSSRVYPLA